MHLVFKEVEQVICQKLLKFIEKLWDEKTVETAYNRPFLVDVAAKFYMHLPVNVPLNMEN